MRYTIKEGFWVEDTPDGKLTLKLEPYKDGPVGVVGVRLSPEEVDALVAVLQTHRPKDST